MRALSTVMLASMMVALCFASLAVPSVAPAPPMPPAPASGTDLVGLVHQLVQAIMRRDFDVVDKIIDDNATIYESGYSCNQSISKKDWIKQLSDSPVASRLVDILDTTVSAGVGVFHFQQAALAKPGTGIGNYTFNSFTNILAAEMNPTNDKLIFIRSIGDQSQRQSNASTMMDVFYAWANASISADVSAMSSILNGTALELLYPPHAKQPIVGNRTTMLADLAYAKEKREFLKVDYQFAYPSCGAVASLVTSFDALKDGRRFVNKQFVAIHIEETTNKVSLVESFPLFWQ